MGTNLGGNVLKKLLLAVLVAASAGVSFAQVDPNRVIAIVNGEEIKGEDYYRRLEFLPANLDSAQHGLNNLPAGFLAIKQLITERLVFQMAKSQGVLPTAPEVDAEYTSVTTEDPKLLQQWKDDGRSEAELRYQVKYNLTQFKIRTAGITITDQEVEEHYKNYPTEFTVPRSFKLRVIVVNDVAAQKVVDGELTAGKEFANVAKAHSLDATRQLGGEFGVATEDQLAADYKTAILGAGAGNTTAWMPVKAGENKEANIKFFVEEIRPEHKLPLNAALKKQLRRRLMSDKGAVRNDVPKALTEATLKAKVEIRQPLFARLYSDLLSQFARTAGKAE